MKRKNPLWTRNQYQEINQGGLRSLRRPIESGPLQLMVLLDVVLFDAIDRVELPFAVRKDLEKLDRNERVELAFELRMDWE